MSTKSWLNKNTHSLSGKCVALFGASGGLGSQLCRYILSLGGRLIVIDRNPRKQRALTDALMLEYPNASVEGLICDLEDLYSVKQVVSALERTAPDIIVHNAGAYSIPRRICETGLDNVFQINFASPYYITRSLLPYLEEKGARVVVVGSVAHNYSKTDPDDVDFRTRQKASLAYGNAKRFVMFSHLELAKRHPKLNVSVVHPGITFTNITAHYPKLIFAIIKHPMKVIFMRPKKAALSLLAGLFCNTPDYTWLGPRLFNVWGLPSLKRLSACKQEEIMHIYAKSEQIYTFFKEGYDG